MNKREVAEIKKHFKKEHVSFSRMAGCYVDGEHNKVCTFNEPFLSLPDDEFFKYLEIAGKVLSGTMNNNLLNLEFPLEEEMPGGHQQFLMGLRESGLSDEGLLNAWYDLVIENYAGSGNYLILIFADAYDVMKKTTDGLNIDESEEVFRYLLAAICPVELSKPGLGYLADENRFGVRIRDWVAKAPETGFMFPAFNNRSADIHAALFYTKDTKAPHAEMMEKVLGCSAEQTNTEKKQAFHSIVRNVLGPEESDTEDRLIDLQENLNRISREYEAAHEEDCTPMTLSNDVMQRALSEIHVPEPEQNRITQITAETFGEKMPEVDAVLDRKAVRIGEERAEKSALEEALDQKTREVRSLQDKVEDLKNASDEESDEYDVVLRVSDDVSENVMIREIGGRSFLMVPIDEDARISLNGEEM